MQKIVMEIVFEIVIEIMIEICMEQTRLFQCNPFHYADFRDWNRDWIFLVLKNSDWNRQKINHRTNTAIFYVTGSTVQKIGREAQADFFREVGGAHEYLCSARAVDDVITSTCSLLRRS